MLRNRIPLVFPILLLCFALVMGACQPAATPTSVPNYIATGVAATLDAQSTMQAAVQFSLMQTEAARPTATFTPVPTLPPPPTATAIPTQSPPVQPPPPAQVLPPVQVQPTATAVPQKLCLQAKLTKDTPLNVTGPSTDIVKKWEFQNVGTCDWNSQYDLRWVSGDDFGIDAIDLPAVAAGSYVEVTQTFDGFDKPGTYKSNWMFFSSEGERFGVGANGASPIVITVEVKE